VLIAATAAKGNGAGLAALYAADEQALPAGSDPIKGPRAIHKFWQDALDSGIAGIGLTTIELFGRGPTATEVGQDELRDKAGCDTFLVEDPPAGVCFPLTLFVTLDTQLRHPNFAARLRAATTISTCVLQKEGCRRYREIDHIAAGSRRVTICTSIHLRRGLTEQSVNMRTVNELLELFMRQAQLERAMRQPGGVRVIDERHLDAVKQKLAYPDAKKRTPG
jgi:hypothetical protein